jgi:hypothetical protein
VLSFSMRSPRSSIAALGDFAALAGQQVAHRAQRGRLAGAVAAQQRHHPPFGHRQDTPLSTRITWL